MSSTPSSEPSLGPLSSQPSPDSSGSATSDRTLQYSDRVVRRARRAVEDSPFRLQLLADMRNASVSVLTIADDSGMLKGYTRRPLSDVAAEKELMWLATVGLLRREVDGQGLTDSFRLTPLGRHIVEQWQIRGCPDKRAGLLDYIKNKSLRYLRIPDWLT